MRCHEVMTLEVIVVSPDDTASTAAGLMRDRGFGFLPVCEADTRAVGTITDRDLVVRALASGRSAGTRVSELMTREVVSCGPDAALSEAEAIMAHRRKSRIMVCDDEARVLGVISLSDIAQLEPATYAGFMLRRLTRGEQPARPAGARRCRDVMKRDIVCVGPDDPVQEAARLMRDRDVGFLPVCRADGGLLYVVTDRDLALGVIAEARHPATPVRDVSLPRELVTCTPDDDLARVEELMATHRKSRLPVRDEGGRLVGVVSLSDVARFDAPEAVGATLQKVSAREAT